MKARPAGGLHALVVSRQPSGQDIIQWLFYRQCQENLLHEVETNFEKDLGSPDLCKLSVGLLFIVRETFVLFCSVCYVPCLMNPFFHWVSLIDDYKIRNTTQKLDT